MRSHPTSPSVLKLPGIGFRLKLCFSWKRFFLLLGFGVVATRAQGLLWGVDVGVSVCPLCARKKKGSISRGPRVGVSVCGEIMMTTAAGAVPISKKKGIIGWEQEKEVKGSDWKTAKDRRVTMFCRRQELVDGKDKREKRREKNNNLTVRSWNET